MPYVFEGEVPIEEIEEPTERGGTSERPVELAALEEDIRRRGIREPICVLKVAGRYRIYDGKSRYLVARKLGMKTVPVRVLWDFRV